MKTTFISNSWRKQHLTSYNLQKKLKVKNMDFEGQLHLTTTSFQYLLFQLVERRLVCCQDLFASNPFSSWIASLKLLGNQWMKIFRGQSCLLPVDMDTPESTFVSHCGKFVMFLVHILCLCFLLSSALFLERSA